MADRVALYLQDSYSLADSIQYVQYAESRRFDAVWQAETRFSRDALVALAAYAASTRKIKLASGVMNIWSRNPATMAASLLTLDDLAPDRVICGLGVWWDGIANKVGIQRHKPLLAMREVVMVLRGLLARQRVSFQGEHVFLDDVELGGTTGRKDARHVPIYIGATNPAIMALTGEIANGTVLNYLVSPQYNDGAIAQLELGARKVGRSIDEIDRPQLVACSVDPDRKKALDTARQLVTLYLRQQPQIMKACGVHPDLLDEIAQVLPYSPTDAQILDAMRLVSDDVVQSVTAAGSPDEVKAKVREYIQYGATYPILYPLGDDVRYMIDVFADGYAE